MRELQLFPPKRGWPQIIGRLVFDPTGTELIAWHGTVLYGYDLHADTARVLFRSDWLLEGNDSCELIPEVLLTPDRRFAVFAFDDDDYNAVHFEDVTDPNY